VKVWSVTLRPGPNHTGYDPVLVQFYLPASFFKALRTHFSSEAEERDASVVSAFCSVFLLVYGDYYSYFLIFRRIFKIPDHLPYTSLPNNCLIQDLSISFLISTQPAAFSASTAKKTSAAVMKFSSIMYLLCVRYCNSDWV